MNRGFDEAIQWLCVLGLLYYTSSFIAFSGIFPNEDPSPDQFKAVISAVLFVMCLIYLTACTVRKKKNRR